MLARKIVTDTKKADKYGCIVILYLNDVASDIRDGFDDLEISARINFIKISSTRKSRQI